MNEIVKMVVTVLGGLALFVYGMGLMSDGLKTTAGERMKAVLGYMTRNRLCAILAGAGVTALVQSSSATTVMTVGFVNAGLLSLEQAIGVIFGANVGTTITGQIVSLKLTDLALPAVTLGVAGLALSRRATTRGAWRTVLGFGLLFFGMNLMGYELKALAKQPGFVTFFSRFDCTPSAGGFLPPGGLLGAIAVGTLCTVLVQSSSATIGITIALAEAGVVNLWTAVPIVLGDNIGTTVTAVLAAIGTNAQAKRTALAHALFNLLGTLILVLSFILVFANASGVSAPAFFHLVDVCASGHGLAGENPGRHVAMAHTLFNITNVLVLAFFIPALARLCTLIIRTKDDTRVRALEPNLLETPSLALQAATNALADMTRRAWTVASVALNSCLGKTTVGAEAIEGAEREIDEMQSEIKDYLIEVSQRRLTAREAQMIPELIHCVNDAERISDLALRVYRKSSRGKGGFADSAVRGDVAQVASLVRAFAHATIRTVRSGDGGAFDARTADQNIRTAIRRITRDSWADPRARGEQAGEAFAVLAVFSCLRDISRHLGNIAVRALALR